MPEDIGELARRIEEKCDEIKQRSEEVFDLLPEKMREDLVKLLDDFAVRQCAGRIGTGIHGIQTAVKQQSKSGFVIIARHIYPFVNYLKQGFIIARNGRRYSVGYTSADVNDIDELLKVELEPQRATHEICILFDGWYMGFTEIVYRLLNDHPMILEMFNRAVSLKRSHEEVVVERDKLRKERDHLRQELEDLKAKIREAAEKLRKTKGIFQSKDIKRIRKELEYVGRPKLDWRGHCGPPECPKKLPSDSPFWPSKRLHPEKLLPDAAPENIDYFP